MTEDALVLWQGGDKQVAKKKIE